MHKYNYIFLFEIILLSGLTQVNGLITSHPTKTIKKQIFNVQSNRHLQTEIWSKKDNEFDEKNDELRINMKNDEVDDEGNSENSLNRRGFLSDAATASAMASTILLGDSATTQPAYAADLVYDDITKSESKENFVEKDMKTSKSALSLPPLGLGAWAWGDSFFWGYDSKQDSDLEQVFQYAVEKDLAFFDTAEIYGFGRSETLLGQFRKEQGSSDSNIQIATKFAALPWRTKPQAVVDACKESLKRLGADKPIDLYQIHFPNAWANAEYWDGLAMCYEQGLVKAVGVSNYGVDAIRATHAALKERGIPLASNQIQVSLLYRWPLENGLLETCKELDVKVLSYSPLCLGFLTGKYSKDNLPSGPRKVIGERLFSENDNFENLLKVMTSIAATHDDATLSQVALNWLIGKGTIPIPGARTLKQAKQNIGTLSWSLSSEEMKMLDEAVASVPNYLTPDASPFQKKDINSGLVMFDS